MRTHNACFSLLCLLAFSASLNAQEEMDPIQLDRPDQTECAFIVPKGYLQFECGFNFERITDHLNGFSHPSLLLKYGVHERFEIRVISETVTYALYDETTTGFLPLTIGFKTNIMEGHGLVPRISFIGHLVTAKTGSETFNSDYPAPEFRFTLQHELGERFSLGYNIGAEWDGFSAEPTYVYTITTGVSVTETTGAYLELFGFSYPAGPPDHLMDAGLTFLLNPDFMMDISGGRGLNEEASEYYVSLGFSARLNCCRKKNASL